MNLIMKIQLNNILLFYIIYLISTVVKDCKHVVLSILFYSVLSLKIHRKD